MEIMEILEKIKNILGMKKTKAIIGVFIALIIVNSAIGYYFDYENSQWEQKLQEASDFNKLKNNLNTKWYSSSSYSSDAKNDWNKYKNELINQKSWITQENELLNNMNYFGVSNDKKEYIKLVLKIKNNNMKLWDAYLEFDPLISKYGGGLFFNTTGCFQDPDFIRINSTINQIVDEQTRDSNALAEFLIKHQDLKKELNKLSLQSNYYGE
ncbi:MAG: hypothetical protein CfClM3_0223 [Methanobrevibacter sp. CfCl-M3]